MTQLMPEKITTKGLSDHFRKIAENYIKAFNENRPYTNEQQFYLLFIRRIANSCASSQLLSANAEFADAKIVIRSAFESLILMGYLAQNPKKISEFKADDEIIEFKYLFSLVKQGKYDFETLYKHFKKMSDSAKGKLKINGTPDSWKANKFTFFKKVEDAFADFRQVKPLAQKTASHLKSLNERSFLDFN
ncbi:MAG: hypothetical protein K2X66_01685, partial [Cyanobacteria bacterium]|nr:hypothetical protein [Cyanobacteriota bacterium]